MVMYAPDLSDASDPSSPGPSVPPRPPGGQTWQHDSALFSGSMSHQGDRPAVLYHPDSSTPSSPDAMDREPQPMMYVQSSSSASQSPPPRRWNATRRHLNIPETPSPPILLPGGLMRIERRHASEESSDLRPEGFPSSDTTPQGAVHQRDTGDSPANLLRRLRVDSPSPQVHASSSNLQVLQGDAVEVNPLSQARRIRFRDINDSPSPEQLHIPSNSPPESVPSPQPEHRLRLEADRTRLVGEISVLEEQRRTLHRLQEAPAAVLPPSWNEYNTALVACTEDVAAVWREWESGDSNNDGNET